LAISIYSDQENYYLPEPTELAPCAELLAALCHALFAPWFATLFDFATPLFVIALNTVLDKSLDTCIDFILSTNVFLDIIRLA
jgi:hypothetical protein